MPLSPEEKIKVKQRNNLKFIIGSAKSAWSFKNARTWGAIYKHLGYDDIAINQGEMAINKDKPVSFQELGVYLKSLEDDLERKLNEQNVASTQPVKQNKELSEEQEAIEAAEDRANNRAIANYEKEVGQFVVTAESEPVIETDFNSSNDYGLHPSPKEKVNLFWFQKKACSELLLLFGLGSK